MVRRTATCPAVTTARKMILRGDIGEVSEQLPLLRLTDQMARQRPGLESTVLIELPQFRHGLLKDAPTDADDAHQAPVAMSLAVLLAGRIAQVHGPLSKPSGTQKKTPKVGTTRPNPPSRPLKYLIRFAHPSAKMAAYPRLTAQVRLDDERQGHALRS